MRTKVTLILLLLCIALYAFIFYFDHDISATVSPEAARRILGPEVDAVERLEIVNDILTTPVSLEKRGADWFFAGTGGWPANTNAVQRILSELQFLEHETSFNVTALADAGQSLADYGLEEPALVLRFGRDAPTTELRVGAVTQVANRLYVLSPDGKRIHVVGRSLADSFRISLDELRADRLFTVPVFEARSLSLQLPSPGNLRVRLSKSGGRWIFETPIQTRADKSSVELTINRLNALKVRAFVDDPAIDDAATGLANPDLRITLEGNSRRETLLLGRAAPGTLPVRYAKLEDRAQVFTVEAEPSLVERLINAQTDMRERRVLEFDPARLTSIDIRSPGRPDVSLQRLETGAWQVVSRGAEAGGQPAAPQPADAQFVARLVASLEVLRADVFLSDAPSAAELENWGFNRPEREIVLNFAEPGGGVPAAGSITLALAVASEREGRLFARVGGSSSVLLVPAETLGRVPVAPRAYRDRNLRTLPPGARIVGVELWKLPENTVVFSRELTGGASTWDEALAAEPPGTRDAALALIAELRALRAQTFVQDEFTPIVPAAGANRPWSYQLETTIALSGGDTTQTTTSALFISERIGGTTMLAGSPEFGCVFEVTQPFLDACFALTFAGRDPGPTEPAAETPPAPAPPEAAPSEQVPSP
ncbi:MAG TPA: DUF4340 domain-containing protein [Opitutaceae bacterium]